MGNEPEDRTLLKWLATLAVVFAMIFALNGFGFASRNSHVIAGGKARGVAVERNEKAKKNGLGAVLGLTGGDEEAETTATPAPAEQGKSGEAPGQTRDDKTGGSVAETPATPDPPTPGRSDVAAVIKAPPPGQAKKGDAGTDPEETTADKEQALDPAVTDTAGGDSPVVLTSGTSPDVTDPPTPAVEPEIVPGNPPLCEGGFKVESPCNGTHTYHHTVDGHSVTITINVYDTPNGQAFDWSSSWPVTRVTAKGGSLGANVYNYDPAATSDGGLHSPPANDKNCRWAGLSHIDFCFGEKPPCDVVKTFELVYPDLPEGARLWVKYRVGDGDCVKVELLPNEEGVYTFVDSHIPKGSLVKGEWLITYGSATESLGRFEEVLCKDKTNHLEYKPHVGGTKYEDLNGNGMRDEGEPGIGDWEITLYRKVWLVCDVGTWEPYATVKTNADGTYSFPGLPPGTYKVTEEERDGWKQTEAPDLCSFKVGRCTNIDDLDFGNLELPDITVLKFNDYDGDGMQDEGEPAISGWTFTLMKGDELIAEKTTGEDGTATWADLDLGTYTLDESLQEGWKTTSELPISVSLTMSGANVTVAVGNQMLAPPPPDTLDLAITKAANPTTVKPGEMVTYRLTFRNLGDAPAENFKIVDDFDQSLVAEVINAGGGVVDMTAGTITWTFAGPLAKSDGPQSVVTRSS